jgi:hypothetical protein
MHLYLIPFLLFFIPQACFGAISAVTATGNSGGSSGGNFTLTSPAGTTTGDVLVVIMGEHSNAEGVTSITDGSGNAFTNLGSSTGGGGVAFLSIWYRVVASGDGTTWTVTNTNNTEGGIMAYRGVNNNNPIDAQGTFDGGTTASSTIDAVTTVSDDAWLIAAVEESNAGGPLSSQTSGSLPMYIRVNAGNGGGPPSRAGVGMLDVGPVSPTGSTGTYVWNLSASNNSQSFAFSLTPAPRGPSQYILKNSSWKNTNFN